MLKKDRLLILLFLATALLSLSGTTAWADEDRSVFTNGVSVVGAVKDTQGATLTSKYALYKSDGYVYRCNSKGAAVSNGKNWTSVSNVEVLFIDSNVTKVPDDSACKILLNGKVSSDWKLRWFAKKKLVFKLNAKGKNACKTIGKSAFFGADFSTITNLEKTSITTIGDRGISYNDNLTAIKLPNTLKTIGPWAFAANSKVTSLTIPGSVRTIGECICYHCDGLKTVTVKSGVTSIPRSAFANCKKLAKVDLPKTVTKVELNAFYEDTALKSVYLRSTKQVTFEAGAFGGTPLSKSTGAKNGAWFYAPSNLLSKYRANKSNVSAGYKPHFKALPATQKASTTTASKPVYWLSHKRTGENLYTTDKNEATQLSKGNWKNNGIVWYAPTKGTPVYRLNYRNGVDHHYVTELSEVRALTKSKTWKMDNGGKPMFYSGGKVRIYRMYSDVRAKQWKAGKTISGFHRFATSNAQATQLSKTTWKWKKDAVLFQAVKLK